MDQAAPSSQHDFLLIGATGTSKSSSGNTILNKKTFQVGRNFESETHETNWEWREYKGKVIKVVDIPGLNDTRYTEDEGLQFLQNRMKEAMMISPDGYTAFLYTIPYGTRFTSYDFNDLQTLKKILRPDFTKTHCVLVITKGDDFEADHEGSDETFDTWLEKQKGCFRDLVEECGNRVILLDNRTKDKIKREAQLDALLDKVNELQQHSGKYTDSNFEKAKAIRKKAEREAKWFVGTEDFMKTFSLMLDKITNLDETDDVKERLRDLSSSCSQLILSIKEQNETEKSAEALLRALENFKESVNRAFQIISEKNDTTEGKNEAKTKMAIEDVQDMASKLQLLLYYIELREISRTKDRARKIGTALGGIITAVVGAIVAGPVLLVLAPITLAPLLVIEGVKAYKKGKDKDKDPSTST
ncbi:immune-associated nucleotide-binding protein 1 [Elysia marginata]|uniref:Immune-associated nucleotide-binding protein 1 n=1 Tax=Elysia marginata TaxID=1093978 RepID=A0AAV4IS85_9GAST|nr:immune-associated nucleotide-binding protein 1 [Elysia marginata]